MHSAILDIHFYHGICVTSQPGKRYIFCVSKKFVVIFIINQVVLLFLFQIKENFGEDFLF